MSLTNEQQIAHDRVLDWYRSSLSPHAPIFTLGGYAGTGKTYTISQISKTIKEHGLKIAFLTFTGKASTVLNKKIQDILTEDDYCGTIHGLLYHLEGKNEKTKELYFEKKDKDLEYDIIILDEASMVNQKILDDLKSFHIPILAVGDHGQLPPV